MSKIINCYKEVGNGLRANPHLEQITRSVPVLGLDTICHDDLDYAKARAEINAEKFLLIRAHLHGVDFLTDLINDRNCLPINVDGGRFYYLTHVKCALGYVGEFKDPKEQLSRREQQIICANTLIASLEGYNKEVYNRLYEFSNAALRNLQTIGSSMP